MIIKKEYVEQQENKASEYLNKLNKSNKWFISLHQTKKQYNSVDFKAISQREHFCDIEVKIRNIDATVYDTIMIDEFKYNELIKGNSDKAYYIQFMIDDSKFWIINLKKIKEEDITKEVTTIHHTQGVIYDSLKYFIPIELGDIFTYNNSKNKYIKTNG